MIRLLLLVFAALLATPAEAQWRQATTRHFIIHGAADESTIREAAVRLEKYHFLLRALTGAREAASPVKLKVYLMRNPAGVQGTMPGGGGGGVLGYYYATARGAFNVNTLRGPSLGRAGIRAGSDNSANEIGQQVLLHEYAHHFMYQYFPNNYPTWYSEGFAEFVSTAMIGDNDVIEVGHPPPLRTITLSQNTWLPLERMLTARSYGDVGADIGMLYAEGWLLVHYLFTQPGGKDQLRRYLELIGSGQTYQQATEAVWGAGARELNSALRSYSRSRLNALRLPFRAIDVGPIEMRDLRPAEEALILSDIRLSAGVLQSEAQEFAVYVRRQAVRFPNDPYALRLLAEAEDAAGNYAASGQAAERLLALVPGDPKGLMLRASAQMEALRAAGNDSEEAWQEAREHLLEANRRDPNDAQVLLAYYQSFSSERQVPPAHAQNSLVRAMNLVPQDGYLRYLVAADFEARDMIEEAITIIRPVASSAHAGDDNPAERARRQRMRERYRLVGNTQNESAREMLTRLERKLAERQGGAAPAAPAQGTPSGAR